MKALRFLITAGPTREFLDPVRFISNRSSGRMGYALAEAARAVSPRVTLISGPTALARPAQVDFVSVTTAQEMRDAVLARFEKSEVVIMAAAVCDFRPKKIAPGKIKKATLGRLLEMEPTPDILAELGKRKKEQLLVGFAVETDNLLQKATDKLRNKHLDLIVANDAQAFDAETNVVTLIGADGRSEKLPEMSKASAAREIVKRALALLA